MLPPNFDKDIGNKPVTIKLKIKLEIIATLIALPRYFKGNTSEINNKPIGPKDIEKETI